MRMLTRSRTVPVRPAAGLALACVLLAIVGCGGAPTSNNANVTPTNTNATNTNMSQRPNAPQCLPDAVGPLDLSAIRGKHVTAVAFWGARGNNGYDANLASHAVDIPAGQKGSDDFEFDVPQNGQVPFTFTQKNSPIRFRSCVTITPYPTGGGVAIVSIERITPGPPTGPSNQNTNSQIHVEGIFSTPVGVAIYWEQ